MNTASRNCEADFRGLLKRIARKRFFIDRRFQLTMAGSMLLTALVCMFVTALGVSWLHVYFLNGRLWADMDTAFWVKAAVIAGFMLTAVALWVVYSTHAVAGPICRIRRVLQDAARGVFPDRPVRFRHGDAFQELAKDVNACLEIMKRNRNQHG